MKIMQNRYYPIILVFASSTSVRFRLVHSEEEYIFFVLLMKDETILFYEINASRKNSII